MNSLTSDWKFSRNSVLLIESLFFGVFLLFGLLYFFQFSYGLDQYLFSEGYFQLALNSHDHLVYVETIEMIRESGFEYGLNNDVGIAFIYLVLVKLFPWTVNEGLTVISFLFNCSVLVFTYLLWSKICAFYKFGISANIAFFLNTSLIYFLQLINKDMLTVCLFLYVLYFGLTRRLWLIFLVLPILFLVRQQLAVFAILFMYFAQTKFPVKRIIFAYIATSTIAGLLSVFAGVIGEDSLGDGFNSFLIQFNAQYYVGYLVFNPIRVLQYIMDAYSSFYVFTEDGGIDMAKLLRIPQLLLLSVLCRPIFSMAWNFRYWLTTDAKPVVLIVVAYLLAWLMNPTINARYVMLITPVILIFALFARKNPMPIDLKDAQDEK